MLCAILSDRGRQILAEHGVDERWTENYVYLFELLLQFEQFMKMKELPVEIALDERRLGRAMDHLLSTIDGTIHRVDKSMGNNMVKNHLLSHIPHYISRWGPPTGMDSGDSERNHKFQVKNQAKWTQRREHSFQGQFGRRWCETGAVSLAVNKFWECNGLFLEGSQEESCLNKSPALGGSHFDVGINKDGKAAMGWCDGTKRGKVTHPQPVVEFLCRSVLGKIKNNTIHGRTEVSVVIKGDKQIFRAHPNYRANSNQTVHMWYDWAKFECKSSSGAKKVLPGQITAIFEVGEVIGDIDSPPKVRNVELQPNKPYAVVRLFRKEPKLKFRKSCHGPSAFYTYSVKWGELRDGFYVLPLGRIVGTVMVVPNEQPDVTCKVGSPSPLGGGFFVIPSRDELGEDFLDMVERESEDIRDEEDEDEDKGEGEEYEDDGEDDEADGNEEEKDEEGDNRGDDEDDLLWYKCRRMNQLERYMNNLDLE